MPITSLMPFQDVFATLLPNPICVMKPVGQKVTDFITKENHVVRKKNEQKWVFENNLRAYFLIKLSIFKPIFILIRTKLGLP